MQFWQFHSVATKIMQKIIPESCKNVGVQRITNDFGRHILSIMMSVLITMVEAEHLTMHFSDTGNHLFALYLDYYYFRFIILGYFRLSSMSASLLRHKIRLKSIFIFLIIMHMWIEIFDITVRVSETCWKIPITTYASLFMCLII